jgi:hypothetical protein
VNTYLQRRGSCRHVQRNAKKLIEFFLVTQAVHLFVITVKCTLSKQYILYMCYSFAKNEATGYTKLYYYDISHGNIENIRSYSKDNNSQLLRVMCKVAANTLKKYRRGDRLVYASRIVVRLIANSRLFRAASSCRCKQK